MVGGLVAAAVLLPLWVLIESRSRAPMLDLEIFRNRLFAAASAAAFINGLARFALMFLFVFYYQGAQGSSPIAAGIKLMPLALGMLIASPLAGIYADRHGSRTLAALGMLLSAIGLAAMTTLDVHTPYWQSALWLFAVGAGSGMFNSPNTAAMMGVVPAHRRGVAAGARTLLQNTGAVLSIAFVLAIITSAVPKATLFAVFSGLAQGLSEAKLAPFIANMHVALWVLAAVSLLGTAVCLLRPRHVQPGEPAREREPARAATAPSPLAIAGGALEPAHGALGGHHNGGPSPPRSPRAHAERRRGRRPVTPGQRSSETSRESLRIGDVARLVGTTPRTIRYYEEIGLLPESLQRPSGRHRMYTPAEVERLREVMRLKDLLGVSLEELKTLLTAEEARAEVRAQLRRHDVDPARRRELLTEALGHIDRQLELVRHRAAELARLQGELSETRKRAKRKIREIDAHAAGSFPPTAELEAGAELGPSSAPAPAPALLVDGLVVRFGAGERWLDFPVAGAFLAAMLAAATRAYPKAIL